MIDRNQRAFAEEVKELLTVLEESFLEIENDPLNMDLIGKIFRAMHTIKGSSSMFGFEEIASFTHEIETAYDYVREGTVKVTPELITLGLMSRDHIGRLLALAENGETGNDALAAEGNAILLRLRALVPAAASPDAAPVNPVPSKAETNADGGRPVLYRIYFTPPQNIYMRGLDPLNLIGELAALGDEEHVAHDYDAPPKEHEEEKPCHTSYDILLLTAQPLETILDVFIFVEEDSELRIERVCDAVPIGKDKWQPLIEAIRTSPDVPLGLLQSLAGKMHDREEKVKTEAPTAPTDRRRTHEKTIQSIKVPSERLDKLVNLVGELVTVQARLTQAASEVNDPALTQIAEEVESLVSELRDNAMSIRMIPIGTTFGRFQRLVRDLSMELGKEIQLVTEGEETELDKTVIERLGDPLVHMIRNSIDHGIEPPDRRVALGKSRTGTIRLSAMHSGTNVIISIADDGQGFDVEAIRLKGVELGLIEPEADPTEREILSLVFAPGFSTAKEVTSVSGRGVGMDVVRRSIEDLGGKIEVANNQGKGSVIILKLPLTLAIIEGLLVKVGTETFILPLAIIKECVELSTAASAKENVGQLINLRGEIIPYVRLRDYFALDGTAPKYEYVVVAEVNGDHIGFAVDTVIGGHQTVIKSLGLMYRNVEGVSGATILGDGTLALIIDVPALVAAAELERERLVSLHSATNRDRSTDPQRCTEKYSDRPAGDDIHKVI